MASSNGKDSAKMTASIDSLKLSSKATSRNSSKHASSESVLSSKKEKESIQMQECKKKLLGMEPQVIIRDDNVVLKSPPQKKIVMPPTINPEELAAATPTERNWRGILIALLVIAAVLGLIVFSIALLTPVGDGVKIRGRTPTLQTLTQLTYKPFNGSWLTGFSIGVRQPLQNITARVTNQTVEMVQPAPEVILKPSPSSQMNAPLLPEEPLIVPQDPPSLKGPSRKKSSVFGSPELIALGNKIKQLQKSKDNALAKLKKSLKLSENRTFQKTLNKFTTAAMIFTMLQFREIGKNKLGRRFTKEEKIMALAMYKQGPRAYRWMRKFFVLPSPLTLSRMITTAAIKPGINKNIFQQLKKKAEKMSAHEKLCILMFDEVVLTPHFDYNRRRDAVVGFVDNGTKTKKEIADHALVFMLRRIQKNYKQPVAYSFCSKTTPREDLVAQIKMIIKKLNSTGFKVIATVCDQGATNVSAINYLINETKANYLRRNEEMKHLVFEIDGEEVIPLYDAPHLLKGIRNNMLNKNLKCEIDGQEKIAKWEHIVQLYNQNPAYQGIRLLPKLTERHVIPEKISKMKVKCASQVFSQTAAATMGFLANEELVFRDRWGGLTLFNVRNFTTRLLMNNSTFRELNAVDFKVSADLKYVLLISDVKLGWKHARLARYHVYDVINRNKITISPVEDDRSAPLLQYAEWAPTGSGLVFVHDNDIYYKPKVWKTLVCRITKTGIPGVIFNGVPDFLYETEVLRLDRALWFSPDGQTLMYVTYNDSLVQEHKYSWYGLDQQEPPAYPSIRTLRYPKANTNNPVVTVFVVSLKTPKFLFPHAIQFSSQVDKDWYVRWTSWISERQIAVLLLNRPQNISIISVCNATSYACQDIFRDESDGSRWSGLGSEPTEDDCGWCGGGALLGGRSGIFTTAPVADQPGTWRHAVRISQDTKTTLTQGTYEVTQLSGWDERRRLLYLIGTAPDKAGERHLYRVLIPEDPASWPEPAYCLTCTDSDPLPPDSTAEPTSEDPQEQENATSPLPVWPTSTVLPHVGDENDTLPAECLYNRAIFSKNLSYYVHECLGPGPPAYFLCSANGERRAVLWDGQPLRQKFAGLAQPQAKVFRVEVQADREARVRLLLPPGFRETEDLPLPLVLHVSAKPGGQLVTEKWQPDWGWYLATARNFIVAEIDARGAGGQGEELRTEIYHKLLSEDVEDQIAVLSYLRDNLKMVDGTRVGVWGQGYGGGAATALAADDVRNVTRCLAVLAPLTDLRHYNSYWTERYSGYGSNWAGALSVNAVWRKAGNLPPRRLLLAHATADLMAPPHHALALARALIKANAVYTHQVYPDEGHNFERSSIHLYKAMEQFFDECFGPVEVSDWESEGMEGLFPFRG